MKYKNLLILFICTIISILIIASLVYGSKLKIEHDKVTTYFNNALTAINEIQDSLNVIDSRDSLVRNIAFNTDLKDDLSSKEQIMLSIKNIDEYISESKKRISLLEDQLHKNNIQISGLQKIINNLKIQLKEKEDLILSLQNQIDKLNDLVIKEREKAQLEISQRDEQINIQQSMLLTLEDELSEKNIKIQEQAIVDYTIFYYIGSEKELINHDFLTKRKLFKKPQKTNNYNHDIMNKLNLLEFQELIINTQFNKIEILTDHDRSSFIIEDWGNQSLFKIINPDVFKNTKYLLIQTN